MYLLAGAGAHAWCTQDKPEGGELKNEKGKRVQIAPLWIRPSEEKLETGKHQDKKILTGQRPRPGGGSATSRSFVWNKREKEGVNT